MSKKLGRYHCFDSLGVRDERRSTLRELSNPNADPLTLGNLPRDEHAPPNERRFDEGNRHWVTTLPPGNYETETAEDMVRINRAPASGTREFVMALPQGFDYSAEEDENGVHIYAKVAGEPDRAPLTLQMEDNATAQNAALRRLNDHNRRHYEEPR